MAQHPTSHGSVIKKDKQDQIEYYRFHKQTGEFYQINKGQAHNYRPSEPKSTALEQTIATLARPVKEAYNTIITPNNPKQHYKRVSDFIYQN